MYPTKIFRKGLTQKFLSAFLISQFIFSPTLFAGGSEPLAPGSPPRPLVSLGSVRGQTHPSILAAVVNYLNTSPEKVKILIQPVNPAVPSGNGFKTYSITYGVKKENGDFFYSQSIARKSTGWTFDPIPNATPKPVTSANQALQGEVALFAGISYESIKSLSSKSSTLGSIQTYEVAYQVAGLKKEAVISREKVGSNDYRYWTEDVDLLRAPFLQKANDAIKKVQDSIAQMDNAVKVFSPQLDGIISKISADIDNQKAKLKSLIGKLDTLKTNPNISSDLKTRIKSFISASNLTSQGLTDSLLNTAIKTYLDNYKISAPVPPDLDPQARAFNQLKSDNQQAQEYLKALNAYTSKILLAKTPLALGKPVFPTEPPKKIISNPDLSALDPRSKIQTAIEAANKLLVEGGDMSSLIFSLSTRTKDAIKSIQDKISKMSGIKSNATTELDAQASDLKQEMEASKAGFKSSLSKAVSFQTQLAALTGVKGKMFTKFKDVIDPTFAQRNGYDDASLDAAIQATLIGRRLNTLTPIRLDTLSRARRNWNQFEKDYQNLQTHLLALQTYESKVAAITTQAEYDQLSTAFPTEPQLTPFSQVPEPDFRGGLDWYTGEGDMLVELAGMTEPAAPDFVNRVASKLPVTGLDVNGDGKITKQDASQIYLALYMVDEIGLSNLPASTQALFKDWKNWIWGFNLALTGALSAATPAARLANLSALSNMIQNQTLPWNADAALPWVAEQTMIVVNQCLSVCSAAVKYNALGVFWNTLDAKRTLPSSIESALPSLMQATLDTSLSAADWISRGNRVLETAIGFLKRSNRIDAYDTMVQGYINQSVQKLRLETDQEHTKRLGIVTDLWKKFRILLNYTKISFLDGLIDSTQRSFIEQHMKLLSQIVNLIEGEAPVYVKKFLDIIEFNSTIGAAANGYGSPKSGIVIARTAVGVSVIVHEIGHVEGGNWGPGAFPYPPGLFKTLWDESKPNYNNYVSGYGASAAHEEWAELVTYYMMDSVALLSRALTWAAAQGGSPILMNKFLILDSLYPQDPNQLMISKIDSNTGKVTKGMVPIKRVNGKITEITLSGKTYSLTYDASGRLTKVTVV